MGTVNDFELSGGGWRNYDHIRTDSLWANLTREDDRPLNGFVGSNIPYIQQQLYPRYTRENDVVLDPFLGTGTSIFVAEEMGRNTVGIDLNTNPWREQFSRWTRQERGFKKNHKVIEGDSTEEATYSEALSHVKATFNKDYVDFVFLHPPYADIVVYNPGDPRDLSKEREWFLPLMGKVAQMTHEVLKPGGWAALLIADMYADGRWIPLSYETWEQMTRAGFVPKGEIIKSMQDNEAKGKSANLWRYRHLNNGTVGFDHEKIFLFRREVK